jgi:histidinol-phosphate aminotransferase
MTSTVLSLVREDLRQFVGYSSARSSTVQGDVWLNANESAWASAADAGASCRRYPDPQPVELRIALSRLYGCAPAQLLMGRGSDEVIDLLVRALCVPRMDAVVITPPVFGMYAVCAALQQARILEVPLQDTVDGFVPDYAAIADAAISQSAKLVFLCSPSNPGGASVPLTEVENMALRLRDRALLVVDEAYGEFSDEPSAVTLLDRYDNIVVLRTLSKAHALAAARIGSLIAHEELVGILRRCQAPYPIPAPCSQLALAALTPEALRQTYAHVDEVKRERERMRTALASLPGVRRVYASQGNFLLVRFADAQTAFQALLSAGVVVRDQRAVPRLSDALRITIGTLEQNDRVLKALCVQEVIV